MSEFNDNKQPRRRRTQLNAAQYAGQQTLDNSIPYPHRGYAPAADKSAADPGAAERQSAHAADGCGSADGCGTADECGTADGCGTADAPAGDESAGAGEPICAKRANARLPRRGTPMQPQQGWNSGVQPLDAAHQNGAVLVGQNPTSMNTGRNQPIRGGQMMPNQPMNPQRRQSPPTPKAKSSPSEPVEIT